MAAAEKLIFPIGFDLQKGVDDAAKEWESTYSKKLQKEIGKKPIEIKLKLSTSGIKDLERITALSKEQRQALKDEILLLKKRQVEEDLAWKTARKRNVEEQGRHNEKRHRHIQLMDQIREEIRLATKQSEIEQKNSGQWRNQVGLLSKLKSLMSAYLGVRGLFDIIGQIREITGEFELQRVSLGAILQNQREANILFSQIQATALKSPFQVKDLVRYTKQLAAYRIEYDELFDTMTRLSDISAGLGVDMNRIILAYGQVKAAAVLRGTELRQFTEAGIPMVDALAKKLTELRGELVTTSQVFGLISERAVSFEVVKDVLMDMTEAGGVFNKMQEKQAKTLKGQWANLIDAKEIMMSEMGDTAWFGGPIKLFISLLRSLANGWRVVTPAIASATVAVTMFGMSTMTAWKRGLLYLKVLRALKIGLAGFAGLVVGAVAGAIIQLTHLNRELKNIRKTATTETREAAASFRSLADQIVNTTDGSIEQSEALEELKRRYGDVIPLQMQSVEALRKLEGAYDGVVAAIQRKIVAEAHEEQMSKLAVKYNKKLDKIYDTLVNGIAFKQGAYMKRLTEGQVSSILKMAQAQAEETEQFGDEVAKSILQSFGLSGTDATRLTYWLNEYLDVLKSQKEQSNKLLNDLQNRTGVSLGVLEKQWKETTEAIARDSKLIGLSDKSLSEKDSSVKDAQIRRYTEFLSQAFSSAGVEGIAIDVSNMPALIEAANQASGVFKVDLLNAINKVDEALNKQSGWRKVFADAKKYYNLTSGKEAGVVIEQQTIDGYSSLNAGLEEVAKGYQEASDEILRYGKALEAIPSSDEQSTMETKNAKAKAEAWKALYAYLLDYFNAWDLLDKKTRDGGDNQLQIIKQRADLIKKLYTEYVDLVKVMDEEIALARLRDEHWATMGTLGLSDIPKTAEEVSRALRQLIPDIEALGKSGEAYKIKLQYDIEQISVRELRDKLEKDIEDVRREITRKQSAKNLFDELLGLTGDKQLSADLTVNLYGGIDHDIVGSMIKELETAFRGQDISGAINGYQVDIPALETLALEIPDEQQRENALKIVESFRQMRGDVYLELYKAYDDFMQFEDKKTLIVERANAERAKIMSSGLGQEQQETLLSALDRKLAKDLNQVEIEQFKEENDWGRIFADLDKITVPTLRDMIAKIKEFISLNKDLTVEQYKDLYEQIEKIDASLAERDPFGVLADSIANYRTALQELQSKQDVYDKIRAKRENADPSSPEYIALLKEEQNALDGVNEAQTKVGESQLALMDGLSAAANFFSRCASAISDFAEQLGISEESEMGAFLKELSTSLSSIGGVLALVVTGFELATAAGLAMETALAPLLAIAAALVALMAVVKYFAGAQARAAEKELERLEKVVNSLEYAFKRLEKAAESSFSSDFLQNYKARIDNLEQQQEAYLKMAEAERSKSKKSDSGKIQDYIDSAQEAADEIKDMRDELQGKFLGSTLADSARDFASAWLEARISFASTADAMKEKFDEMMQNLIVESVLGQVMQKALEPVFSMIDSMQESDFYDAGFWADITKAGKEAINNGMVGAENVMSFLEASGVRIGEMGSGLTGISKDIATASEESILGLAAGINTQNFYISQIYTHVALISRLLQGEDVTAGTGINLQDLVTIQNQHLSNLPNIAANTANTAARCERAAIACERIADDLSKVIKPKGVSATHTVSTSM